MTPTTAQTGARRTSGRWWIPMLAVMAILGAGVWLLAQGLGLGGVGTSGWGPAGWHMGTWGDGPGDGGRLGSDVRSEPTGRVADLDAARARAEAFAQDLQPGMTVGEVMEFDNQYYAEIFEPDSSLATEVLVDPDTGVVQIEYGPARMWNSRYGMMTADRGTERIGAEEARRIADEWLATERPGLTADEAEAFPGYYTLHSLRDGRVAGMLSVNATTGDVWYHTWHGEFVDMTEPQ